MPINQREVYLLPFPFPESKEDHLFIVLSIKEANDYENSFIGVMITSSNNKDYMSFALTDDMFEKPLMKPNSHVRMHLIVVSKTYQINGNPSRSINRMKDVYFKQMMLEMGEFIFNYEFKKLPEY